MHLVPRETEKLMLYLAGKVAEDRKNGLKESRGYISLAGQNCPVFLILNNAKHIRAGPEFQESYVSSFISFPLQ